MHHLWHGPQMSVHLRSRSTMKHGNCMIRRTFLGRAGRAGAFAAATPVGAWAQAFTNAAAEGSSVVDPIPESTRIALGVGADPMFALLLRRAADALPAKRI